VPPFFTQQQMEMSGQNHTLVALTSEHTFIISAKFTLCYSMTHPSMVTSLLTHVSFSASESNIKSYKEISVIQLHKFTSS
jgi:hypothetical protein